ncbi:signal peptidase II [Aristophania vespae]|uniref:Lipoprotein signal peptidase n=1 Tax=Aristophania vespae TaxID=2697033 RepID=A0A6P1NBS5_9PROT|nr:signal peptidase II [Aristophania vespae]QHI94973.1 signal peptidase II [Aristophania vespae]UMM64138.1 Lipoprotein signal peptidase [Aristophania vespae]
MAQHRSQIAGKASHRLAERLAGLVIIFLVLLADQVSKYWILYGLKLPEKVSVPVTAWLNFTMVWNHAVTFGMFGGHGPWIFITISLIAVLALFIVLLRSHRWLVCIACGGIIGGAIGNVIDRLNYGAVVDFLHFHVGNWSWYVFNIADSAIVCGVGLWIIDSFIADRRKNISVK